MEAGRRLPAIPETTVQALDPPSRADVVVIGAGVIGLAIAWSLARRGLDVVVLDRDRAGAGASLAATGMLAAAAEFEPGGEILLPLALASRDAWPSFARDLTEASGVDLDFDATGTLLVALTRDELERLRARHALHERMGLGTRWLSGAEARLREPGLRPSISGGVFCPQDGQVDPRRVVPALALAARKAGATLIEGLSAQALSMEGGRVTGVMSARGACRAQAVVLATGAWAAAPDLLPPGVLAPVRPLRGQSLALRGDPRTPALAHVVWTEQVHLAPKAQGRLIVGATVEETGFDPSVTAGGAYALLEGARRALPSVEDMALEAIWSGFRPTSEDDAPIIGEGGAPGLVLAIGHHRNGILLAPATAQAVVAFIEGRPAPAPAAGLGLARFARSHENHRQRL